WSDVNDSRVLNHLKRVWTSDEILKRRAVIDVPGRLEETLGSYFSFAQICPFFFLRGLEASWRDLPARERRRARDEQIDEVGRLGSSLLLFDGYASAAEVF